MSTSGLFRDQLNREVIVPQPPRRIVSLVPSQTELLHDLGLGESVIGITKFCVHPETWREEKSIVGGTKNPRIDRILELNPDLVIANKEENRKQDIEALESEVPVWVSDVGDVESALEMMRGIGAVCRVDASAERLVGEIKHRLQKLKVLHKQRVLYLIWKDPYMAAGPDTFIHHMLHRAGFENALSDPSLRYPKLESEEIKRLRPDVLLLSSEPFPFKGKHKKEVQSEFPELKTALVDGEAFSWYGSRMLKFPAYIDGLRSTEDFG